MVHMLKIPTVSQMVAVTSVFPFTCEIPTLLDETQEWIEILPPSYDDDPTPVFHRSYLLICLRCGGYLTHQLIQMQEHFWRHGITSLMQSRSLRLFPLHPSCQTPEQILAYRAPWYLWLLPPMQPHQGQSPLRYGLAIDPTSVASMETVLHTIRQRCSSENLEDDHKRKDKYE